MEFYLVTSKTLASHPSMAKVAYMETATKLGRWTLSPHQSLVRGKCESQSTPQMAATLVLVPYWVGMVGISVPCRVGMARIKWSSGGGSGWGGSV